MRRINWCHPLVRLPILGLLELEPFQLEKCKTAKAKEEGSSLTLPLGHPSPAQTKHTLKTQTHTHTRTHTHTHTRERERDTEGGTERDLKRELKIGINDMCTKQERFTK